MVFRDRQTKGADFGKRRHHAPIPYVGFRPIFLSVASSWAFRKNLCLAEPRLTKPYRTLPDHTEPDPAPAPPRFPFPGCPLLRLRERFSEENYSGDLTLRCQTTPRLGSPYPTWRCQARPSRTLARYSATSKLTIPKRPNPMDLPSPIPHSCPASRRAHSISDLLTTVLSHCI